MAKKKKLPTGTQLVLINSVLRGLAMSNIFIGDYTVVRLTKDIEHKNVVDKVVHVSKAGECFVAEVRRYDWSLIVPAPGNDRMSWLPVVAMTDCEVVPQTAEEQLATMLSYIDINNPEQGRHTQHVNTPLPSGAIVVQPA